MKILRSMLSRRAALGRMLGAAALAPTIAQTQQAGSLMQGLTAPPGEMGMALAQGPGPDPTWLIKKPLRDLFYRNDRDLQLTQAYRLGAFDPDIAALNSVAYSQRVRMQRERDLAARNNLDDLRRKIGWLES